MHPKKFAQKWAMAGLLAVGLGVWGESPAAAQDKKDPMPMATSDRTGAINVSIGAQVRFKMKTGKRIKEAFNENERVVQVLADAADPTSLVILGRGAGTSKLEVTDIDGAKENYLIIVARPTPSIEILRNLMKKTLPTANIEVTPIGEAGTNVVLSGYVTKEEDRESARLLAQSLGLVVSVNSVSVGGGGNVPHVQLDLTLAKVDRTRARTRGASFIINGTDGSFASLLGGLTSLQQAGGAVAAAGAGVFPSVGAIPTAASTIPAGAANLIFGYAPAQFQLLLSALKTEGLAKLVSAPTIVARSGEEANLLVGAQIPVISAAAGINGPGVTYRPVGTELRFLPVVYGNGKIHLSVSPRVTAVNNAQALATTFGTSPAFEEQQMTTSVIVEPGQTIAIGGLIQTSQQGSVTKIPHLGDIPFLGALFSFSTQTEQEIELVILLTPRLVDPADCTQMPKALPGSETRKPDDYEFYLETILEAPRGQRQIWDGHHYIPAWKSSPTSETWPCPGGSSYGGAAGNCPDGKCGPNGAAPGKVGPPPSSLPPMHNGPSAALDVNPPSALLKPEAPSRKTAELPNK